MIRIAKKEDAPGIQAIYAPFVEKSPITFETDVPSLEEFENRLVKTLAQYPWLVFEYDGEVAGYAYASQYRVRAAYQWSAEVAVYVHRDHYGKGIGTALYTELFKVLVRQGYYIAVAGITLPNNASVALHEALGFEEVGVFDPIGYKNGWHPVGFWQLILQPLKQNPPAPVPFRELQAN